MGDPAEPSDDRLAAEAAARSLDAFNRLVDRHQSIVFSLCYRLLGDRQSAEDATQETFLSAYRAVQHFTGSNVRGWFLRIAANASKDELRRRRRKGALVSLDEPRGPAELVLDPPDPGEAPANRVERFALAAELQRALDTLPFDQRQVIVLVDIQGFGYEEVAALTRTSVGTVKSRIHRGRERLRRLLTASGTNPGGSAL
jgi:RNA polymerase sigma-70 factor (ECF subfamily)